MSASKTGKLQFASCQAMRKSTCALTGDTIDPGEKCWWVMGHGMFRQDLTEDDIREWIKESGAPVNPYDGSKSLDYQKTSEGLACELEEALEDLKRRGADLPETDTLRRYRARHPRQDS